MASETTTREHASTESATMLSAWQAGLVGGLAGGLVFGAMMSTMTPPVLEMGIPAMYGIEGPAGLAGWVIHMSHAAVLGVVFAALVSVGPVARYADSVGGGVAGLVYGLAVWALLAVVVMPIWLGAVGFPGAPPLPNVGVESLVGHAAYGLVLGIVHAAVR